MEALVNPAWRGRRVLVTGHRGFKGSWLAPWLHAMGAVHLQDAARQVGGVTQRQIAHYADISIRSATAAAAA